MSAHAKLSASGAHRWMVCPASVRLEADKPDTASSYANEGTVAHSLAENCLTSNVLAKSEIGEKYFVLNGDEELVHTQIVDLEMAEYVQEYLDFVSRIPGEQFFETKVDYSAWVEGGFGTCDFISVSDKTLNIVDLKYGKGVRVEAQGNKQLMLYALGALAEFEFLFGKFETIKLTIVQPRLDHISEAEISYEDLLAFGELAREKAKEALSEDSKPNPDEHACTFCKAKGTCKALADHNLALIVQDFEEINSEISENLIDINTLTNAQIADILPHIKPIEKWLKAIEAHAQAELEQGREVPLFKLVEGRSVRKWIDDEVAEQVLKKSRLKVSEIYTKKLISPTQAEKLFGKGHPIVEQNSYKPEGAPTIAPESDKRPAINVDIDDEFKEVA